MIKPSLSLKTSLVLSFLLIALVIVIGYSLLSYNFFFRGMDSIVSVNMERALQTYTDTYDSKKRLQAHEFSGYTITSSWAQQPAEIREIFRQPPVNLGDLRLIRDKPLLFRPTVVHFLITLESKGQRYFVSRKVTRAEVSPLIGKNARESEQILYGVTSTMIALLIFIVWMLFRRFSQPIARLQQWTDQLSPNTLKQTPPDFVYPELNEMAELIRNSLSSVNDSLEREHNFLRFTSHELRTPISVIRNNIQLVRKLESTEQSNISPKNKTIIDRIDRASLTMQHLSETLLWLSRDNLETLPAQTLQLDQLISNIIEELTYLLNNKQVEVHTELTPYTMQLPCVASHIVIANLIRNAFQHTWSGRVEIYQQGNNIMIRNYCDQFEADKTQSDLGFGLGLRLTEELCDKLQWSYQNIRQTDGHEARLVLHDQPIVAE